MARSSHFSGTLDVVLDAAPGGGDRGGDDRDDDDGYGDIHPLLVPTS